MASQSSKGQIVFLFSLMTMVFVVLCYLAVRQLRQSNHLRVIDEGIESAHLTSLEIFKTDVDFFGYELNNKEFFRTGNSNYLQRHDSLMNLLGDLFKRHSAADGIDTTMAPSLIRYDSTFRKIVRKIKDRGYQDYGLEGKMRAFAHELGFHELVPKADLLTLRLYEKDYLLQFESSQIERFDSLLGQLKSRTRVATTAELLDHYARAFHELAKATDDIGLETQTNLKGELNDRTKKLISAIEELDRKMDNETQNTYQKGLALVSIGVIGAAILCITCIILIARKL